MTERPGRSSLLMIGIAWAGSRSWKIVSATAVTLLLIGYFGMWEDTMKTISMIFVCTSFRIAVGIPLGIADGALNRMQASSTRCSTSCRPCRALSI
jgi:glycine betaine/proline transport system permease protein